MKTWDTFTRSVLIDRSIEDIYQLWVSSEGITQWFLKSATYTSADGKVRETDESCQADDTYNWSWHNWDGSSEGKILIQNGQNHIKFEFDKSVVDVTVETFKDGRSLLSLVQSEMAEDDQTKMNIYCGCSCGWTFWLTNLKAFMEHGIVLNERGDDLKGVFDGYQLVNT